MSNFHAELAKLKPFNRSEPPDPAAPPLMGYAEIMSHEADADYCCPKCGWEPGDVFDGDCIGTSAQTLVETSDYSGHEWAELWKCPECGTVFALENGDA